jgi:hypothetical protein
MRTTPAILLTLAALAICACGAGAVVPDPPAVPPGIRSDLEWDVDAARAQFAAMATHIDTLEAGIPSEGRNPGRISGLRTLVRTAIARMDRMTIIAAKNRPEQMEDGTTRWSRMGLDGTGVILDQRLDWREARTQALLSIEEISRVNDEVSLGFTIADASRAAITAQVELENRASRARALVTELPKEFP